MPSPTARITPHWTRRVPSSDLSVASPSARDQRKICPEEPSFIDCAEFMPCVLYQAESAIGLTHVSDSIFDLLGFRPEDVVGWYSFWQEHLLSEDFVLLEEKFRELDSRGSASLIHRIINSAGLPVWVSHSLRRDPALENRNSIIRGCLVPVGGDKRVYALDETVIAKFVHNLGNQFQLLTLVINSLKKTIPASRETEILQDTVEKAIELTRSFSDYNQLLSWVSEIQLADVLRASVLARRSSILAKNVVLEDRLDSVSDVAILADPFLLEVAFGQVLENILENATHNCVIEISGRVEIRNASFPVVILVFGSSCSLHFSGTSDSGKLSNLTSKKARDSVDLSVASRFIDMHGGLLRVKKSEIERVEIEISLPLKAVRDYPCA